MANEDEGIIINIMRRRGEISTREEIQVGWDMGQSNTLIATSTSFFVEEYAN